MRKWKMKMGFCVNNITKHKMKVFRMCCFIKKNGMIIKKEGP